jgi:hypothetical protein
MWMENWCKKNQRNQTIFCSKRTLAICILIPSVAEFLVAKQQCHLMHLHWWQPEPITPIIKSTWIHW